MNYIEYGKENKDVIIFLHGGGLSWWNYRETAEFLQNDYRIILPILDGHAESDRNFTTIESNASEIIDFIDENFDGKILLIGGLSIGGQILIEILSQRNDICQYAVIESALVLPSKLTASFMKPALDSSYSFIRNKNFAKLQFKALRMKNSLFGDYYRDTCALTKENLLTFMRANLLYTLKPSLENCKAKTYIFVGGKEKRVMKKSAEIIHRKIKESQLQILPKMYHGEFSVNYAESYAEMIRSILHSGVMKR